eukprot:scaffold16590_cov63-Phaeocystis_antarctica.AAC.1
MAGVAEENPGYLAFCSNFGHISGIIADGTSGIVNIVLFRALETGEKKKSWERASPASSSSRCGGAIVATRCHAQCRRGRSVSQLSVGCCSRSESGRAPPAPPSRQVGHLLRGLQPAPASTYASSACAFALTGFTFRTLLKSRPYTCLVLLMPA